ncbi:MAG TPA: GGDEF domain-containing protein [Candidatus Limnocylindrales bacterium]|nr:GGDEF domain-containing protein [Candidatus Limnocylindrales bacterium]
MRASNVHGAVERSDIAGIMARAGAVLIAALLAPATVAVLRLFPPLALWAPGAPGWLGPSVAVAAGLAVGIGGALRLADGLRRARLVPLIEATALGALAAGLGAGAIHAAAEPASFPDGGLPIAMLATGLLLLGARLTPDVLLTERGRRVALVGVAVAVAVEGVLAASLFAPVPASLAPWLSAGSAGLAAAASVPGPVLASGLLAGAFAAMTAMRPGALDAVAPLAAMLAAGVCFAWPRSALDGAEELTITALAEPATQPPPRLARASSLAAMGPPIDDEALRLARELRGTIEELLHARRTIELQREEIARTATHDPLTGVPMRRVILERLAIEAAESQRYTHPVAVVLVDVDGFTRLNQDHGLAVGDAVLRELALRLRLRMRAADALGRVGGDSFMAILPHSDERGAAVFADALRRRLIARPIATEVGDLTIGVSIGVAFMRPGMSLTSDDLLAAADEALASARAAGGNRIAFDRHHGLARLEERATPASDDRSEATSAG